MQPSRASARPPLAVVPRVPRIRDLALSVLATSCASNPPAPAPPEPRVERELAPPAPDPAPVASSPSPAGVDPDVAEKERVLATVDRFFVAIADKDKETFAALLMPEGVRLSQIVRADSTTLRTGTNREVLERFGEGPRVVERYWSPTVMVHGPIAVFWAPYVLWADGKENHRGVDVLQLLRVEGEWRIATAMWTSEPGAPESFRPPDPAALRPATTP